MKVFLSGSIRGGRQMLPTYQHICKFLRSTGADVLSWHVADPELEGKEAKMSEKEIYDLDIELLKMSDCLVAEVTVPSIGVGCEIYSGLDIGLPVLCIHKQGADVSAMLLGNSDKNISVEKYTDYEQLENIILDFVRSVEKRQ
ncbi:MAG: deoxyribonucleoside 5'-monophosphate N-glycosidase [Methanosarcinaceae archaeon]|nr:nucleoside 2-deoxyribosyltransferase [Methanosarcinaceae archaeon]MDF1534350.1 deoxyribonucleoside 5'-monophosphate N-glycosidase [Methanosarcinaceae archaeon]